MVGMGLNKSIINAIRNDKGDIWSYILGVLPTLLVKKNL